MKEATGELNATVVVVLTIGLLSTFFFTIIWPRLKGNLNANTRCSDAVCKVTKANLKEKCVETRNNVCVRVKCTYDGTEVICPYKG